MFPSDVWRSAVVGALIGATITLLCVKIWGNHRAEEREERAGMKLPQEHDERFR